MKKNDPMNLNPIDIFGKLSLPDFPVDRLPSVLAEFVKDQSEIMGTDPALLAMPVIVACAAAIDDGLKVQVKRHDSTWQESARLWGALVGDPSIKKSPVLTAALKPVQSIEINWREKDSKAQSEYQIENKIYNKKLKKHVEDRANGNESVKPEPPADPPNRRAIVEDITTEALSEVLKDNDRGILCVHDELSGFFGSMDAYKGKGVSKDRPVWLQAFNGGPRFIDRVTRGSVLVPNLSTSIIGGIQPEPIAKIAKNMDDDGLLQRFFFINGQPSSMGIDRTPNMEALRGYRYLIEKLYEMKVPDYCFIFSEEAHIERERLSKFAHDANAMGVISQSLVSHMGKWDGLFARLALTFHIVEYAATSTFPSEAISGSIAENVSYLMRHVFFPHAIKFYGEVLGEAPDMKHARWIAGFILSRELPRITNKDITINYRALREKPLIERQRAMDVLSNFGWVEPVDDGPAGPKIWTVNPVIHQKFSERAAYEKKHRKDERAKLKELFSEIS
ncbi:MAG: DUF3987 domain-containing protein [Nitrospinae bacterium]|nr:DUF3987 domain-containing protein [Nitrospinota bacterium]